MTPNRLKATLRAGRPAVGTWLTLGSLTAARFLARAGFDWLCVDLEHSPIGPESSAALLGAIADAGCVPLARVPANRHDHLKQALDAGAFGVVVPMVNTPSEAASAVAACKYPPRGTRSVGGALAALNFGAAPADYYACADDEVAVILQCEHADAVRDFDAVFGRPAVDAVFVGPNDLAASLRGPDGSPPSAETFEKSLAEVLAGCRRLGVAPGIHTFSVDEAKRRLAEGWQFVAVGSDLSLLLEGARAVTTGLGERPA